MRAGNLALSSKGGRPPDPAGGPYRVFNPASALEFLGANPRNLTLVRVAPGDCGSTALFVYMAVPPQSLSGWTFCLP